MARHGLIAWGRAEGGPGYGLLPFVVGIYEMQTGRLDEEMCLGCGDCLEKCQFDALSLNGTVTVNELRCVGCGVCVLACPDDALGLVHRPEGDFLQPPVTESDWLADRALSRGLDLFEIL